jgi:hypothetical protein
MEQSWRPTMIFKCLRAAVSVVCLGLMLASCADFVANHWPHFAGGEPNGLPPRPGEPGYQQFIAHGQQSTGSVSGEAQPPSSGNPDAKTGGTGGQPPGR